MIESLKKKAKTTEKADKFLRNTWIPSVRRGSIQPEDHEALNRLIEDAERSLDEWKQKLRKLMKNGLPFGTKNKDGTWETGVVFSDENIDVVLEMLKEAK